VAAARAAWVAKAGIPKLDPAVLRARLMEEAARPDPLAQVMSSAPAQQDDLYRVLGLPPEQEEKLRDILRQQRARAGAVLRGVTEPAEFDQVVKDTIEQTNREVLDAIGPAKFLVYQEHLHRRVKEMAGEALAKQMDPPGPSHQAKP
jgi:hypothetical protein